MPNFMSTLAKTRGDIRTQSYAQWVVINLYNDSGNKTVVVKNVHLGWGKFYKGDDKDDEIPVSDIENAKITPRGEFTISSCGREDSASGTDGEFDIYEDGPGGKLVRHFYWDSPWGGKTDTWTISGRNDNWVVVSECPDSGSGALGNITVRMINKT